MKRRLFEDTEIPDVQRQVAGMGTSYADAGGTTVGDLVSRKNGIPNAHDNGVPYPLDSIDSVLADVFLNLNNVQQDIDLAKGNPVLKSEKKQKLLNSLEKNLKDITKSLVDFDETLSIIKGNE